MFAKEITLLTDDGMNSENRDWKRLNDTNQMRLVAHESYINELQLLFATRNSIGFNEHYDEMNRRGKGTSEDATKSTE
jgi:hypothetical protein